ncbi:MAG: hypothetical protein IT453_12410, partial [Planctomycetes bacterium]|nr:hypothetical protein [Planctomycetota bacterium]
APAASAPGVARPTNPALGTRPPLPTTRPVSPTARPVGESQPLSLQKPAPKPEPEPESGGLTNPFARFRKKQ